MDCLSGRACVLEALMEFKRVRADGALTYFAKKGAWCLKQRLKQEFFLGSIKLQSVCAVITDFGI